MTQSRPAPMSEDLQKCAVCGKEIDTDLGSETVVYCYEHDPDFPWVTAKELQGLEAVPPGYRSLVEKGQLHEMETCGDFYYLHANRLNPREFEALNQLPNFQPFAKAGDGALWCWQTDASTVDNPEIYHVETWGTTFAYAPTFETFLYRCALEDASGRWSIDEDDLAPKLQTLAGILGILGRGDLADDLLYISSLPFRDLRDAEPEHSDNERQGMLTASEGRERIERYLGSRYLREHEGSV